MQLEINLNSLIRRKKMILLVVCGYFNHNYRLIRIAETLRKSGYKVTILELLEDTKELENKISNHFGCEIVRQCVEYENVNQLEENKNLFTEEHIKLIKINDVLLNIDLIYTFGDRSFLIGKSIKDETNFSQIIWLHDFENYGERDINEDKRHLCLNENYLNIGTQLTAATCADINVFNKLNKKHTIKSIYLLINCPRIGDVDEEIITIKESLELNSEKKLILYLDHYCNIYQVDQFIKIIKNLPGHCHGAVVTSQSGNKIQEYLNETSKDVKHRVHFINNIKKIKIPSAIKDCDFCILGFDIAPNLKSKINDEISELIIASVPFLDIQSLDCTTIDSCTSSLLSNSDSLNSIVNVILKVINNEEKIQEIESKNEIIKKHTWEYYEAILIREVFDEMLINKNLNNYHKVDNINLSISKEISICHLPAKSAGQPHALAKSLRTAGFNAISAVLGSKDKSNKFSYPSDYIIEHENLVVGVKSSSPSLDDFNIFLYKNKKILSKEIYHFHARSFFYHKNLTLKHVLGDVCILNKFGSRVYFHFRGSECRLESIFNELNPFSWFSDFNFTDDELKNKKINLSDYPYRFNENAQKVYISRAKSYATEVFITDPELGTYVPNATVIPRIIESSTFERGERRINNNNRDLKQIIIAHAPSRPSIKGTAFVISAIETLISEGYNIKLDLIQGVPHSEALARYEEADLVIDQLRIGWYGVLTVEAMALGVPVICYVRDDLMHNFPLQRPFINANPESLLAILKKLLSSPEQLEEIGRRGHLYARSMHHPDVVGGALAYIYSDSWTPSKNLHNDEECSKVYDFFETNQYALSQMGLINATCIFKEDAECNNSLFLRAIKFDIKKLTSFAIKFYELALDQKRGMNIEKINYINQRISYLKISLIKLDKLI